MNPEQIEDARRKLEAEIQNSNAYRTDKKLFRDENPGVPLNTGWRKYGTQIIGEDGRIVELFCKVKLGESVTWLGRKIGVGVNDPQFKVGSQYEVCHIYENGDLELQAGTREITIRVSESEYLK